MPSTYEPIATNTLSSAQASYTFTSIPGTYTDLILVFNGAGSTSANLDTQVNGDTGSNYSFNALYGTGSTVSSNRGTNVTYFRSGYITTAQSMSILQFQNYANTTTYKSMLGRFSPSGGDVEFAVSMWRSTSAITSILIKPSSGNLASGSVITLYGIKAA